jgi:isoleucyl-tRNA synthetase
MTDAAQPAPETRSARDYSKTLFLPKTDFPMRAGLPKKEPEILARWEGMNLYRRLREEAKGRTKFVLHDGPPYANGHLHIGHALNKTLKDVITRARQMAGFDSNYVPGWDCHGLPIEWKIEEQYRAKGRNKDEVPINEFRRECRDFAAHWIGVQAAEFKRLGVTGDFDDPYTTMAYPAEAIIAGELMKFAKSGQLYRGSKPVMWSVVERTALAEAEVEYHEHQSDTVWVKFPVSGGSGDLEGAFVVIWTTTPWTIPGNRAIAYSDRIGYGLYEVTAAPEENWARPGDKLVLADALAESVMKQARVESFARIRDVRSSELEPVVCTHPLRDWLRSSPEMREIAAQQRVETGRGYDFVVPLLPGEHVTEEAGTGFVHTAPGHGREDFELWIEHVRRERQLAKGVHDLLLSEGSSPDQYIARREAELAIPYTVGPDGAFTKDAPGFEGRRVITDKGETGDANKAVIAALTDAGMLLARGRLKHQYPHSWRSKKPVIFRNTPQWFIHMDRGIEGQGDSLRARALAAIDATRFYPPSGQNRLRGMIEGRPDWVVSRQRAWGVPITVFVHKESGEILQDEAVNARITAAFREEGADAWFADGAHARFLGPEHDPDQWEKVDDILDVWFDSGSTHAFVLEQRPDLKWPADLYLEGSDQHRGWFHSSLLESCGTRGRAPYDAVLTHGFTMDEEGRKMSKSLGNTVAPQDVVAQSGADILRLWVVSTDYFEDQRIGPEILKTTIDSYRKLRNSLRWMLGSLAHFDGEAPALDTMPELERLMLHRLAELDEVVRAGYEAFDFKRVVHAVSTFMNVELSAFYFDIRKDALYCDPLSSTRRKAALFVIDRLFDALVKWLAPMLPFTMEEAWLSRRPSEEGSVHLELFPEIPQAWRDEALAQRWAAVRRARRVVLGALEIERAEKRIGSSLDAAPVVFVEDEALLRMLGEIDFAEACITSGIELRHGPGPAEAFRLEDVPGVAVAPRRAEGRKCARSWKVSPEVGSASDYPDLTPRDAQAMRELEAAGGVPA